MKLVSYTLMTCTLNEVLRTKISESPPLAPSLGTRTSQRSRRLAGTSGRKKGRGARASLSRDQRRIYKISSNTDKKVRLRATAKIWAARASEHSFKFCEQIELPYL